MVFQPLGIIFKQQSEEIAKEFAEFDYYQPFDLNKALHVAEKQNQQDLNNNENPIGIFQNIILEFTICKTRNVNRHFFRILSRTLPGILHVNVTNMNARAK